MKFKIMFSIFLLLLLAQSLTAKDWRGIIPLKSTRLDVERRFGKPDKWGDYTFEDERMSVEYSDGPCRGLYETLAKDNCKCLVQKDTVISIFVEPTVKRRFSELKLDLNKFKRTAIAPFPHTFAYYNFTEGIDYAVDESEDEIKHITYYDSPHDCEELSNKMAPVERNAWRGLVPLRSNRTDVERLFGTPINSVAYTYIYRSKTDNIHVVYSRAACEASDVGRWNVPSDTILKLTVYPQKAVFVRDLHLNRSKYYRYQDVHPENWVHYFNSKDGITVDALIKGSREEVMAFVYAPSLSQKSFRCPETLKYPLK